jgi:3-phenylpropionate/trans-cinnamate dioxygenase ferredoxin reductase subunit
MSGSEVVVVVGAGLAGLRAVQTLRAEGFDGEVVVVGEEPHPPYDRPSLSKGFLLGTTSESELLLLPEEQRQALDAQWWLGAKAVALEPGDRRLTLADGSSLRYDGLVLATGARARTLPAGDLSGVLTLRTREDASRLRDALLPGARVTIAGAGLLGAEVAATARHRDCAVTLVEADPAPFARLFGPLGAAVLREVHAEHGVALLGGVGVAAVDGVRRVDHVTLTDGRRLPTDLLLVAIGALPDTAWLVGSGVEVDQGVRTDEACRTNVPRVVAAGDVARFRSRQRGTVRDEHWTNARDMPVVAVKALLAQLCGEPAIGLVHDPLSYFWSEQYTYRLQVAGDVPADGDTTVVEGDPLERRFAALVGPLDHPAAVVGWDSPKAFSRRRRELAASRAR